jgi:hypothetical protein
MLLRCFVHGSLPGICGLAIAARSNSKTIGDGGRRFKTRRGLIPNLMAVGIEAVPL